MTAPTRLELKNFLAGRGVVAGLLLIFAAGVAATANGHRIIEAQRAVVSDSPRLEAEHRRKMIALHGKAEADGPGNLLYYLAFFTTRAPSPYAPLAAGLRDVTPYNLRVRILTLEGQIRDSEIGNPESQALGHFDLTFVLSFLYPLLIAAFLHDTLSSERESGTWDLIRSHPVPRLRLLLHKAALRFAPIPLVWMLTLGFAGFVLGLPLDARAAWWILLSLAYLAFWFCASLVVVGAGRSSSFNALALLSVWLTLAIVIPVASNLGISWALPSSDALEAAMLQREGYHRKWDRPREETMRAFFSRYPEYAGWRYPQDRFSWAWYYAMQHQGDEEAAAAASRFRTIQSRRESWSRRMSWLAPPAMVESVLTRLAGTGLEANVAYLDSVRGFHERVRRFFYPLLFQDPPVAPVDWSAAPRHRFSDDELPVEFPQEVLILVGQSVVLASIAGRLLARRS